MSSNGHKYDILKIIEQRNQEEEEIGKLILEFEKKIDMFFEYVKSHKNFKELKAKMFSANFSEDEVYNDFRRIYNAFIRRKRKEVGEFFIKETKVLVEKLCDDFEKLLKEELYKPINSTNLSMLAAEEMPKYNQKD